MAIELWRRWISEIRNTEAYLLPGDIRAEHSRTGEAKTMAARRSLFWPPHWNDDDCLFVYSFAPLLRLLSYLFLIWRWKYFPGQVIRFRVKLDDQRTAQDGTHLFRLLELKTNNKYLWKSSDFRVKGTLLAVLNIYLKTNNYNFRVHWFSSKFDFSLLCILKEIVKTQILISIFPSCLHNWILSRLMAKESSSSGFHLKVILHFPPPIKRIPQYS